MTAYTSIIFTFDKKDRKDLVHKFYDTFFSDDVIFTSVLAWGCNPDMSLENIIEWNQDKLDNDFELAYEQHVEHDYRQILMAVLPFSECRLYIVNDEYDISFHCIVPEDEIDQYNAKPLENACRRIWSKLPVKVIESYGEFEDSTGLNAIQLGTPPSARLFAITDIDCIKQSYINDFLIERLDRGYFLKRHSLSNHINNS